MSKKTHIPVKIAPATANRNRMMMHSSVKKPNPYMLGSELDIPELSVDAQRARPTTKFPEVLTVELAAANPADVRLSIVWLRSFMTYSPSW